MFPVAMIAWSITKKAKYCYSTKTTSHTPDATSFRGTSNPARTQRPPPYAKLPKKQASKSRNWIWCATRWFERKQMLMIGFLAGVTEQPLRISTEVDYALWASSNTLLDQVVNRPGSVARYLCDIYLKELDTDNIERVH